MAPRTLPYAALLAVIALLVPSLASPFASARSLSLDASAPSVPSLRSFVRADVARAYNGPLSREFGMHRTDEQQAGTNDTVAVIFEIIDAAKREAAAKGVPVPPDVVTEGAVDQALDAAVRLFQFCQADVASFDASQAQARAADEANAGLDGVYGDRTVANDRTCLVALTDFVSKAAQQGGFELALAANSPSDPELAPLLAAVNETIGIERSDQPFTFVFGSVPEIVKEILLQQLPPQFEQVNRDHRLCEDPGGLLSDPRDWQGQNAFGPCGDVLGLGHASSSRLGGSARGAPGGTPSRSSEVQCDSEWDGTWQTEYALAITHPLASTQTDSLTYGRAISVGWLLSKPDAGQCDLTIVCDGVAGIALRATPPEGTLDETGNTPRSLLVDAAVSSVGASDWDHTQVAGDVSFKEQQGPWTRASWPEDCSTQVSPPILTVETFNGAPDGSASTKYADATPAAPTLVESSYGGTEPDKVLKRAASIAAGVIGGAIGGLASGGVLAFIVGGAAGAIANKVADMIIGEYAVSATDHSVTVDFTNGHGIHDAGYMAHIESSQILVPVTPSATDARARGCAEPCASHVRVEAIADVDFFATPTDYPCFCSGLYPDWTGYEWQRSTSFDVPFAY